MPFWNESKSRSKIAAACVGVCGFPQVTVDVGLVAVFSKCGLFRFAHRGIGAPGAGACECEIQENEAEQDRELSLIDERHEALRGVTHEISDSHLTGEDECHGSGEQSEDDQRAAHQLEHAGKAQQREQLKIGEVRNRRKAEQLCNSVLQEQQACHDAKHAENAWCPRCCDGVRCH